MKDAEKNIGHQESKESKWHQKGGLSERKGNKAFLHSWKLQVYILHTHSKISVFYLKLLQLH